MMKIFWLVSAAVYALDVITKSLVRQRFELGDSLSLLPFFSLTHIENSGIAFGLFPGKNWLFVLVGIGMSALIVWMAWKEFYHSRLAVTALSLVFGGAWGNLTDRMARGAVTDFLDFYIGAHHWPAFNVADSAICVGAVFLLASNFYPQKKVS